MSSRECNANPVAARPCGECDFCDPDNWDVHKLRAKVSNTEESAAGARGCLDMIREELESLGCLHEEKHQDATPPMMYPEWIRCVVKHWRKKERAKVTEVEKRAEIAERIADEAALFERAATEEFNEKGAGGYALARLSDLRTALKDRKRVASQKD